MRSLLHIKELPYFLTAAFLAFGWMMSRLVDKELGQSLIEYRIESQAIENDQWQHTFKICNLSTDLCYRELNFRFRGEIDDGLYKVQTIPVRPAFINEHSPRYTFKGLDQTKQLVQLVLPELQPGWTIHAILNSKSETPPIIQFSEDPEMLQQIGSEPILLNEKPEIMHLQEANWKTFIKRKESGILLGMVLIWSIVIILYLRSVGKKKAAESDQQTAPS